VADVPIFVIFLSEKCHPVNLAIELTHPKCYRKGRFEPVLSCKPVDRGIAMRIILVCVHVKPDQADASRIVKEST
jgi:hypothetical protein